MPPDPQLHFISQFMQNAEFFSILAKRPGLTVLFCARQIVTGVERNKKGRSMQISFWSFWRFVLKLNGRGFFNCYLAAPRPTLGHYQGESLTNPMLITAF